MLSGGGFPLRLSRLPLYARFVRFYIIDGPLAMLVGVAAASHEVAWGAFNVARAVLIVLIGAVLFYLVHALDDITGARTGIDVKTAPRKASMGEPKLLATGAISYAEARAVAVALGLFALGLTLAFIAMASPFVVAMALTGAFITGQYSYGARWSYRGLGEATVFVNFFCCVVVTYAFFTDHISPRVVALGALAGLFVVSVTFCSNLLDIEDDRSIGRTSLVVLLGERGARVALATLLFGLWILYGTSVATGLLPSRLLVAAPLALMHLGVVWHAFGGRVTRARRYAFLAGRLHAVLAAGALFWKGW